MGDTLRDRIAAAAAEAITTRPIPPGGYDQEDWLRLADAVIRDVLTPEFLADLMIAAVQKAAHNE